MGMFDTIEVHDKFMPDKLKRCLDEFQTKSLGCFLDNYLIDENGVFFKSDYCESGYDKFNYSGDVCFYSDVNGIWYKLIAILKDGLLISLTQIEPVAEVIYTNNSQTKI